MILNGLDVKYTPTENSKGVLVAIMSFTLPVEYYFDLVLNEGESSFRETALDKGFSVLTVNLPGMGESEIDFDYTIEKFAINLTNIFDFFDIDPKDIILFGNSGAAKISWLLSFKFQNKLNVFYTIGGWPVRPKLVLTHYGLRVEDNKQSLNINLDANIMSRYDDLPDYYHPEIRSKLTPYFDENGNKEILLSIYHDSYKLLFELEKGKLPAAKTVIITSDNDSLSATEESETLKRRMNAVIIDIPGLTHYCFSAKTRSGIINSMLNILTENNQ